MVKEYCNQFHLLKTDYDKSDIVYISNPNPSNGDRISDEYLINEIEKYNKFFIIDLAYDIYVKETISDHIDLVSKLMKYNNVLVLISFSKMTGLSGCRVGIGLTNSKNILTIRQPWNISSINIQLFKKIFRYSTISTHQSIIKESMKSFIIEQGLNVSKFSCPIVMLKHDIKSPTRFYPEYNEFRYSVIDTKLL
jgi:histidinol-phosphate/aromatic aminotransferase/cobyric acid decarboxylase-like protein